MSKTKTNNRHLDAAKEELKSAAADAINAGKDKGQEILENMTGSVAKAAQKIDEKVSKPEIIKK